MYYLTFIIFLASFAANAVSAGPIRVRSGEHEGFTRIVFDIIPGTKWTFKEKKDQATISFSGHKDGFNISSVFDRISRSRVKDISFGERDFSVAYSCTCNIRVFLVGTQMIVMDVREGEAEREAKIQERTALDENFAGRSSTAEHNLTNVLPAWFTRRAEVLAINALGAAQSKLIKDIDDKVNQEISVASNWGLLTGKNDSETRDALEVQKVPTAETHHVPAEPVLGATGVDNIKISSSQVHKNFSQIMPEVMKISENSCMSASGPDISEWGDDASPMAELAKRRSFLFGEADTLDEKSVVSLSQLYLNLGFGAEAIAILQLDQDILSRNRVLLEMGEILEFGHVKSPSVLDKFQECRSGLSLWAALRHKSIPRENRVNVEAALRALSALPIHLRRILAPMLSERLLEFGDPAAANVALSAIERIQGVAGPATELSRAKIELADNRFEAAQEKLQNVIASNTEHSKVALIELVEAQMTTGMPTSEEVATLVAAYSAEQRAGPLAAELRRAQLLSLAQSQQFDAAFELLSQYDPSEVAGSVETLRSGITGSLVRNSDDIVFLEHIFTFIENVSQLSDYRVQFDVAERLESLGFPDAATQFLLPSSPLFSTAEAEKLKARIALAHGHPVSAEVHLRGLEMEKDQILMPATKKLSERYERSRDTYTESDGSNSITGTTDWSEEPVSIRVDEVGDYRKLAELALKPVQISSERDGMLARGRKTLKESALARSIIEAIVVEKSLARN